MNTQTLFQVLERIHPLPDDFKKALENELQPVAYPKGYLLVQEHSIANNAYFLEKGFSVAYHFHDTRKIATRFWKENEIILSPKSFFEQLKSEETIQLTMDSELLLISYQSVNKLFENFSVANFLSRAITARFHATSEQSIVDLHHLSAWKRYIKLIKNYPGIELKASQDIIASYLNITPQSLSRLKRKLN